jgi:chemotaxis protein methyltransferase CheR
MPQSNHLPDSAFLLLRELIHQHTGNYYENDKDYLLMDKLAPLIAERGFDSALDYYFLLKHNPDMDVEWRKIYSNLAVNESYFWREIDQIQAAAQILVPQLQETSRGKPVRIWHAACASGEEPYTMAIALLEAGRYQYGPIEIIATDYNEEALKQACQGLYRKRSFRSLPPEYLLQYFQHIDKDRYQLVDQVKEKVKFSYLNLMNTDEIEKLGQFDIIFCRNAFIYFSETAIKQVVISFHRSLRELGYLFIASVESLLRITTLFELVEVGDAFAYKKEAA